MYSHPNDPDGGYRAYFNSGFGTPPMVWVENGVLKNLAYDTTYAMQRGKAYDDEMASPADHCSSDDGSGLQL
jgi:hypothetical protein